MSIVLPESETEREVFYHYRDSKNNLDIYLHFENVNCFLFRCFSAVLVREPGPARNDSFTFSEAVKMERDFFLAGT